MNRRTISVALAALAAMAMLTVGVAHADSTIVVTGDTAAGENQPGWMFGRDAGNQTPYEFNFDQASIGTGSLYVAPIGANPSDKFIGELFVLDAIESASFDYFIENGSNDHVYMNIYANTPEMADVDPGNFYQCRFDYVADGAAGGWNTVSTDVITPSVTKRGGANAYTGDCVLDDMVVRAISLNWGQSTASDESASGWLDNVRVTQSGDTTTYDFEVPLQVKSDCKDGGYARYGFSNQGECVSALQANENAGK